MAKYLFYGQVLPILLKLDPDDLLECRRASPRLIRLVSGWQVWAHLLKGVVQFSRGWFRMYFRYFQYLHIS